ncbi:hypothetical protein K1719_039015 [Acacia pycnantha]|nr:hypothetical protein K1719_039015 [Acacia pycnantha]
MLQLAHEIIKAPPLDMVPKEIRDNPKHFPYFKARKNQKRLEITVSLYFLCVFLTLARAIELLSWARPERMR